MVRCTTTFNIRACSQTIRAATTYSTNANANSGYTAGTYSLREDVPAGWQQKESPRTQYVPYGAADPHYRDFDFGNQKKIDVGIVKTSETPITIAGEETSWFLRVTNHSSYHAAPNTVVTDTLPAGFTEITEIDSRCTVSGISFTCPLGTLAASASTTIRLKSRTDPGLPKGTQLVNWAYVDTPHDTNPDNDSDDDDTEIDTEADVSIVKEADAVYYDGGDAITYILTVRSAGPSYALDVRAVDTVPADIEVVSAVDADAPGVTVRDYPTVDGLRAGDVTLSGVKVGVEAVLGEVGNGLELTEADERAVHALVHPGAVAILLDRLGLGIGVLQVLAVIDPHLGVDA